MTLATSSGSARRPMAIRSRRLPDGRAGRKGPRRDAARRHAVDGNSLRRELPGQRLGKGNDATLGGRINAEAPGPHEAGHRRHQHQPALALLHHDRQYGMGKIERAVKIEVDDGAPVRRRNIQEIANVGFHHPVGHEGNHPAGVTDCSVDAAVTRLGRVHELGDCRKLRDVGARQKRVTPAGNATLRCSRPATSLSHAARIWPLPAIRSAVARPIPCAARRAGQPCGLPACCRSDFQSEPSVSRRDALAVGASCRLVVRRASRGGRTYCGLMPAASIASFQSGKDALIEASKCSGVSPMTSTPMLVSAFTYSASCEPRWIALLTF